MAKPKKETRKALIARKEAENRQKQRDQASKPSGGGGGGSVNVRGYSVKGYTRRKPKKG